MTGDRSTTRRRSTLVRTVSTLASLTAALSGCERGMHDMYDQKRYKPMAASPLFGDGRADRPQPIGSVVASSGALAGTSSGRLGGVTLVDEPTHVDPVDGDGRTLRARNEVGGADAAIAPIRDETAATPSTLPQATGSAVGTAVVVPSVASLPSSDARRDVDERAMPMPITAALLARGRERFGIYCTPCHGLVGDGLGTVVRRGFPQPPTYHSDRLRRAPDGHFYAVVTLGYGAMLPYADRIAPDDRWAIVAYVRALQRSQHATVDDVPPEERASLQAAGR